ncbi:MAG: acetate--CoA ligase family protein, partial [Deltaproteobacteria bacterium]|nr:acetate--CoA ligase family protein [Deltaproteobacteria bacterium]
MRLYEYEAADFFENTGIPVPRRGVAETTEEAIRLAGELGYPVVLKAQVLVGGRGLAGGIKTASGPDELEQLCSVMFNSQIKGLPVRKILVSEMAEISTELYMGVTIDGYTGKPIIVTSTQGGVHIEKAARTSPANLATFYVDPEFGFYPYQARTLMRKLGLSGRLLISCADILVRLYRVFTQIEAITAEINPLVV